ncbi:hypothetical protein [Streptomyces sp. TR02-1]|uniref:hypothetical protein n=1 Tax=Streptomyces sp. TR02-1 TaxID=3385977 RepID=UPI0039A356BA
MAADEHPAPAPSASPSPSLGPRTRGGPEVPNPAGAPAAEEGGEPACLLDRVCPACGRLADAAPPTVCPRCGGPVGAPH